MPRSSLRSILPSLVLAAAVMSLAAACGDDEDAATPTTTTTTERATTSTAPPKDGGSGATGTADAWARTAAEFRGQDGSTHDISCTAGGTARSVWGAGTYTDDSSVCTAAVQMGLITFEQGGSTTFQIAPGQGEYPAGTANGVTSSRYGAFAGSFTFPDAPPGSVDFGLGPDTWSRNASEYRGKDGTTVSIPCAPGGPIGSVWGTGTYTDDSSICTAAVHAGVIDEAAGGTVVIEIAPGQASYQGSAANGVTSSDYGQFGGSFRFPST